MQRNMNKKIASRIKEARKAAGMSQARLAEIMGCAQQNIAYLESGSNSLTVKSLQEVANALNCDLNVLLEPRPVKEN